MAKQNTEGITTKKEENFSEWYQELITKADLADYTKVSGCMVFKPLSYAVWEKIKEECDKGFKKIGVKNSYFPLFIPESLLSKEQEHVKGFIPEVAWVTQAGNTKLNEKLAIRPTSEAIMYESYSKWIRSWRDLPLLYNQWNNVVRWEFKNPVPFFRTREFLWNELHSVFSTEKESIAHGKKVMKVYDKITEDLMALPGFYGRKTEKEKFAGAVFSEKMHHYLPNGKVIEGTCFHYDGQNFAKAYNIKFKTKTGKEEYVYQNTHAISTRMLGVMFAIHSDNKGLILPPKIAPNKIVMIPIRFEKDKKILKKTKEISKKLSKFNPIVDERLEVTPGWKFNEWELKGIPLRIEIGPKDLEKKQIVLVRRDNNKKTEVKINSLKKKIEEELKDMQNNLFKKAEKFLKSNIIKTEDMNELNKAIKNKKIALAPLCKSVKCEDWIKDKTGGAKTINIPKEPLGIKNKKCIWCKKQANYWVYIAKSY